MDKLHSHIRARSVCLLYPFVLGEHNSVRMSSHASHQLVSRQLTLRFESGKGPLAPPTYQSIWMQASYPNTKELHRASCLSLSHRIYRAHFSARANILLFCFFNELFGCCLHCGLHTRASPLLFVSVWTSAHLQQQMIDFFPFFLRN